MPLLLSLTRSITNSSLSFNRDGKSSVVQVTM
jgi:hypothetical protein